MFSQGKVVYANYGRREDLENLQNEGMNLRENIALVRAGNISLAEKVPQISNTAVEAQFLHFVLDVLTGSVSSSSRLQTLPSLA